ncbi:uncharacterized protein LOC143489458 [Brachyhypopomus gauderio]|uniref:uncharacterized protein LOC143489458 n=1 Tax=Brachyhypopomus gauderio TaxID=698409 RepID=UPI0040424FC9
MATITDRRAQKQAQCSRVHSALREGAGRRRKLGQADDRVFHRKLGDIPAGCSNANISLDTLYHSGCQGDSESSTISHDVTLFHILQVLQSKTGGLPEVRGPGGLKSLQHLKT